MSVNLSTALRHGQRFDGVIRASVAVNACSGRVPGDELPCLAARVTKRRDAHRKGDSAQSCLSQSRRGKCNDCVGWVEMHCNKTRGRTVCAVEVGRNKGHVKLVAGTILEPI